MTNKKQEPQAPHEATDQDVPSNDVINVGISGSYPNPLGEWSTLVTYQQVSIHDLSAKMWTVFAYNKNRGVRHFLKNYKRKAPALKMPERVGKYFGVEPVIDYRPRAPK